MKRRLAQEPNPYSPDTWLGVPQVLKLLLRAGYNFTGITVGFATKKLETGGPDQSLYISKRSVETYIKCRQHEESLSVL